jgi:UDP-N-acetyl-D-glucosamine dehydrogenase
VRGSRILMLGIAYKKNVDDTRESPAVEIMELLRQRGALIEYADPHLAVFPRMREHRFDLASQPTDAQSLEGFDCVVLATDHDAFDYAAILQHANLIVDARGRFPADSPKVVRA